MIKSIFMIHLSLTTSTQKTFLQIFFNCLKFLEKYFLDTKLKACVCPNVSTLVCANKQRSSMCFFLCFVNNRNVWVVVVVVQFAIYLYWLINAITFDTIDHAYLLLRLRDMFGIQDQAIACIRSY